MLRFLPVLALFFVIGCNQTETTTVETTTTGTTDMKEIPSQGNENRAMGTAVQPGTE